MEENTITNNKRLVQEIVDLVFHRCLCNKQNNIIKYLLVRTNLIFSYFDDIDLHVIILYIVHVSKIIFVIT